MSSIPLKSRDIEMSLTTTESKRDREKLESFRMNGNLSRDDRSLPSPDPSSPFSKEERREEGTVTFPFSAATVGTVFPVNRYCIICRRPIFTSRLSNSAIFSPLYPTDTSLNRTLSRKFLSMEENSTDISLSRSLYPLKILLVIMRVGEVRLSSEIMKTEVSTNNSSTRKEMIIVLTSL